MITYSCEQKHGPFTVTALVDGLTCPVCFTPTFVSEADEPPPLDDKAKKACSEGIAAFQVGM